MQEERRSVRASEEGAARLPALRQIIHPATWAAEVLLRVVLQRCERKQKDG